MLLFDCFLKVLIKGIDFLEQSYFVAALEEFGRCRCLVN